MLKLSQTILDQLSRRDRHIIPVVEFYTRKIRSITSTDAPINAFGLFSNTCFDWETSGGTYRYDAKILDFPEVSSYLDERINTAEVKFSAAKRGEGSMTRFVLDNQIKGCWMVIRLIFPDLENESLVVFWGKCERPGEIDNKTISITASQELGNYKQKIPFRTYQIKCPLEFARAGGGCLGDETLQQKSIAFQEQVAKYGTAGCNKLSQTCILLGNSRLFQAQKVVAVSGQFSYITVEEVVKRVLFWTKRKKIQTVKTDSWSSVNQSEGSETIPIAIGRCQIPGHPFTWADEGEQVRSLQGFCEGKISAFTFIRSRTEGINVVQSIEHLGDWGGVGTQGLESLFGGVSGFNSRLAYLELVSDGSSPTQVDNAPLITSVIRGLVVPIPDPTGEYTVEDWTNNPAHLTRFFLNDIRFGRIPDYRIETEAALDTAEDCDEIVEDRTNDEALVLPANEAVNYGDGYRRFRSASRYTAYKDLFIRGEVPAEVPLELPEFEEPEIRWFDPFQPYVLPERQVILRQKYAINGALQEQTSLLDFLYKRIFPCFKGYLNYSPNGKIQIKNRRKADNAYLRMDTKYLATRIPVTSVQPWRKTLEGYIVIGVSLEEAELRTVTSFDYSTACNGMPITAIATGQTITASTSSTLSGGGTTTPALGYIQLGGSVTAGDKVSIDFNSGDDLFTVSYLADGIEDVPCFARMLTAHLNANPEFAEYLTAYILPSDTNKILVRCESGYLNLDKPLEYTHVTAEEVLRVQAVFENCGELTANTSAQFDNIIEDSFKWNNDEQDEINAVKADYISAVDDFQLTTLIPRAAWDTIDLEGEINEETLDLKFTDNYWQAAHLTKGYAIDNIDGNLHFGFKTSALAARLEFGDVVAVRHDSGDGALNYIPVWITKISFNLDNFTVDLGCKLYLSAAFDFHIQPVEPLLTTTLNSDEIPSVPPETIGTSGGSGGGSDPRTLRRRREFNVDFSYPTYTQHYSQFGDDIV